MHSVSWREHLFRKNSRHTSSWSQRESFTLAAAAAAAISDVVVDMGVTVTSDALDGLGGLGGVATADGATGPVVTVAKVHPRTHKTLGYTHGEREALSRCKAFLRGVNKTCYGPRAEGCWPFSRCTLSRSCQATGGTAPGVTKSKFTGWLREGKDPRRTNVGWEGCYDVSAGNAMRCCALLLSGLLHATEARFVKPRGRVNPQDPDAQVAGKTN